MQVEEDTKVIILLFLTWTIYHAWSFNFFADEIDLYLTTMNLMWNYCVVEVLPVQINSFR